MSDTEQEFYDAGELCRYVRMLTPDGEPDLKRLYWLRYQGLGPPAIRIGGRRGRLIFRRSEVEKWLESRAESASAAS